MTRKTTITTGKVQIKSTRRFQVDVNVLDEERNRIEQVRFGFVGNVTADAKPIVAQVIAMLASEGRLVMGSRATWAVGPALGK